MRNGIINAGSSKEDVLAVLTGVWNEYDDREWHVVKTPFMVAMTATLDAGPNMLPVTPPRAGIIKWANADHSGSLVMRAKDRNFVLPEKAVVEAIMLGTTGDR